MQLTGAVLTAAHHLIQGSKQDYNDAIIKRFAQLNSPVTETATDVLGLIATASAELSQSEANKYSSYRSH